MAAEPLAAEHTPEARASMLVKYLDAHGCPAWVGDDGQIYTIDFAAYNGILTEHIARVDPSYQAVRDYLGY